MKRNAKWWFSSLIMLLVLVLSFSAAGEELTVSSKVNAELYAEKALEEKYGITPVMLDYFVRTVEKTDENIFTIKYTGCESWAYVLGTYEVFVDRNTVTNISWSRDGEGTSGGLDAEAWGSDQILEMLRLNQQEGGTQVFDARIYEINQNNGFVYTPPTQRHEETEQEKLEKQKAQELRTLPREEMNKIAKEAVVQLYGLSDEQASRMKFNGPDPLEDELMYYCMVDGEPCYRVLLGVDPVANTKVSAGEVQYNRGEGTYWVAVNVQTGTIEDISYFVGIGGNG